MATPTTLARANPFQELETMRRMMDRMWTWPTQTVFTDVPVDNLAIDMYDKNGTLVLKAALPGVKPNDISVTFDNGMLTIKGTVEEDKEIKEEDYHLREYRYSYLNRSVRLPTDADPDKIKADFEDGMLRLTIPRHKGKAPKKIAVEAH